MERLDCMFLSTLDNLEVKFFYFLQFYVLSAPVRRPVLIIGPLSESVMDRLTIDFCNLFKMCDATVMDCSQETMDEGLQRSIFVDYRRKGNKFECTTVETINNTCRNVCTLMLLIIILNDIVFIIL